MATMDLISDLSEDIWEKRSESPTEQDLLKNGYLPYNVFKRHLTEDQGHEIIYYLKREDGRPSKAKLVGLRGKRDPLKEIRNCLMRVHESDGQEPQITGIAVDDDWVELKGAQSNGN